MADSEQQPALASFQTQAASPAGDRYRAVRLATEALTRALTPEGGVVLLSPAAPSFGLFRNYAERGEAFAKESGF